MKTIDSPYLPQQQCAVNMSDSTAPPDISAHHGLEPTITTGNASREPGLLSYKAILKLPNEIELEILKYLLLDPCEHYETTAGGKRSPAFMFLISSKWILDLGVELLRNQLRWVRVGIPRSQCHARGYALDHPTYFWHSDIPLKGQSMRLPLTSSRYVGKAPSKILDLLIKPATSTHHARSLSDIGYFIFAYSENVYDMMILEQIPGSEGSTISIRIDDSDEDLFTKLMRPISAFARIKRVNFSHINHSKVLFPNDITKPYGFSLNMTKPFDCTRRSGQIRGYVEEGDGYRAQYNMLRAAFSYDCAIGLLHITKHQYGVVLLSHTEFRRLIDHRLVVRIGWINAERIENNRRGMKDLTGIERAVVQETMELSDMLDKLSQRPALIDYYGAIAYVVGAELEIHENQSSWCRNEISSGVLRTILQRYRTASERARKSVAFAGNFPSLEDRFLLVRDLENKFKMLSSVERSA